MPPSGHSESARSSVHKVLRARLLQGLFLLGLPPFIFWLFNIRANHQVESLDPYYYTGYINNARDLLLRLDLPYYSVRFGLILPGRFWTWALGSVPGYFTYHYLLALAGGIPLYWMTRRVFSAPAAIVTYVALMSSAWFERTVLWDHPDAAGVPYLIAAMCTILIAREPCWWRDALAGFWVCMAVNSNVFTGVIFGIFAVLYAALSLAYGTPWRSLLRRTPGFLTGCVVVLAVGYSYYWYVFGAPRNIFLVTFNAVNYLSAGGMKEFRTPGKVWLAGATHIHVAILISLCCLLLTVRRGMRLEAAVCALTGPLVIIFFFVHQFLLNGDTLQLPYYFSYALPSTFLMLASIWHELWTRVSARAALFIALAVASTLIPTLASANSQWLSELTPQLWPALIVMTLVSFSLARFQWRKHAMKSALAFAVVPVLSLACSSSYKNYYRIARPFPVKEDPGLDQYRVALQLMKETPKLSDGPGNVLFWYNDRIGNPINSVQLIYVWGYTRLNRPADPGMPYLGEFQMGQLRSTAVRYIVLLGETPQEVTQGLEAIKKAGVGYDLLTTRDLHSGAFHVYWQLIELTSRPPEPAAAR